MKAFQPAAWMVEFSRDLRALFLDQARAMQYAADSHGTIKQLYELVDIPDPPQENACDSPSL